MGDAEAPSPLDGATADPVETRYSTHVSPTKFGRSRSKCLGVGRVPKTMWMPGPRPLGMGTWLTPRNMLSPLVLPYQIR